MENESNEKKQSAAEKLQEIDNSSYIYQNRRYVGVKETVGFVLWDTARDFNIDTYSSRFVTNVLQIDLGLQAIEQTIVGIWDVVNDVFMGAIIDKTRTRWGKFRPYLLILSFPAMILTSLYWLQPLIFSGTTPTDITKFIFYLIIEFIREGISTFNTISRTGLLSTITPHPVDRTRLITIANLGSSILFVKLPEQLMTVLLDLIDNNILESVVNMTRKQLYLASFVGMGVACTIVSSITSFWFFMICRERVTQSIEKPSIRESIMSILNNKPVLLLTLSDFFSGFSISGSKTDYYADVLHFASMKIIAGIPGAPLSPASYAYVPWLRRHFSSRLLYIAGNYSNNILLTGVFFVGTIGMKKDFSGGIYQNKWAMMVVMMVWEILYNLTYGLKKVIGTEMFNETMDYCEWKNGYRTEAMTSVAKGLASKVSNKVADLVTTLLKKAVNYSTSAYLEGREQTDFVKFYLFAAFTIMPAVTGIFGIFPILFYDLDGKKKEQMYSDLLERRAQIRSVVDESNKETENQE